MDTLALITCVIYVAKNILKDSEDRHVWALAESDRVWYFPVPLTCQPEESMHSLPASVMQHFQPLEPTHYGSPDAFAYRMGVTQLDEAELERNWIVANPKR